MKRIMHESGAKVVTRPKEERSSLVAIEGTPEAVQQAYAMMFDVIEANRAERASSAQSSYRSSRTAGLASSGGGGAVSPSSAHVTSSPKSGGKSFQGSPAGGAAAAERRGPKDRELEWGAPKQPKFASGGGGSAPASPDTNKLINNNNADDEDPSDSNNNNNNSNRKERTPPKRNPQDVRRAKNDDVAAGPRVEAEVPFPQDKAGLLLGKEGSNVKFIKRRSKAGVFIDTKACVVRISGSAQAVEAAKALVSEILARKPREKPAAASDASSGGGDDGAAAEENVAAEAAPEPPKNEQDKN